MATHPWSGLPGGETRTTGKGTAADTFPPVSNGLGTAVGRLKKTTASRTLVAATRVAGIRPGQDRRGEAQARSRRSHRTALRLPAAGPVSVSRWSLRLVPDAWSGQTTLRQKKAHHLNCRLRGLALTQVSTARRRASRSLPGRHAEEHPGVGNITGASACAVDGPAIPRLVGSKGLRNGNDGIIGDLDPKLNLPLRKAAQRPGGAGSTP